MQTPRPDTAALLLLSPRQPRLHSTTYKHAALTPASQNYSSNCCTVVSDKIGASLSTPPHPAPLTAGLMNLSIFPSESQVRSASVACTVGSSFRRWMGITGNTCWMAQLSTALRNTAGKRREEWMWGLFSAASYSSRATGMRLLQQKTAMVRCRRIASAAAVCSPTASQTNQCYSAAQLAPTAPPTHQ